MVLALGGANRALAAPGDVLQVQATGVLPPAAVDAALIELFANHTAPPARYAVATYLLRYESVYPDGEPATITAQLFVPADVTGRPNLYFFAPGTTGLVDACRVSREHIAGINWGRYRAHVLAFAGQGHVGLLPDYPGFGDPERTQTYFHAATEGRMMLNGIRAVRRLLAARAGDGLALGSAFLAGYSQGGHAMFAAADMRADYAPDVEIAGVIGYGPTRDVATLFREFTVTAPMLIYSYASAYGADRFDPAQMLQQRWLDSLDYDVTRQCIGAMQRYYPWRPEELFRPDFTAALRADAVHHSYPVIGAIMHANSPGLSGHGVPALILQGTDDIVIDRRSQDRFVTALRAAGSDVRYLVYQGSRHDTRQISFADVQSWMGERVAER